MQNNLVWLALLVALMYFMIIRPQQKQKKQRDDLLNSLMVGAEIITIGGIHGKIISMTDMEIVLEVSPGVRVIIQRSAVGTVKSETIDEADEAIKAEAAEETTQDKKDINE